MSLERARELLRVAEAIMELVMTCKNKPKPQQHVAESVAFDIAEISCLGGEPQEELIVVDKNEQPHVVSSISHGSNMENTEIFQTCQEVSCEEHCFVLNADIGVGLDDISICVEEVEPHIQGESFHFLDEAKTPTLELSLPSNATWEDREKIKHGMVLKPDISSAFLVSFEACYIDLKQPHFHEKKSKVIGELVYSKWISLDKDLSVGTSVTIGFVANHGKSEICHGFNGEALIMSRYMVKVFDPGGC